MNRNLEKMRKEAKGTSDGKRIPGRGDSKYKGSATENDWHV